MHFFHLQILKLRPDIVVKGKEFQSQYNPEEDVLKSYGGELLFSAGELLFSSIDLLRKEIQKYNHGISLPESSSGLVTIRFRPGTINGTPSFSPIRLSIMMRSPTSRVVVPTFRNR